jgi:hypothetical protein
MAHNHTIEDLVVSKGDISPFANSRKMMITIFKYLKEELEKNIQKQLNESQENTEKRHKKIQK